jgi:hypothetical protein
VARAEAFLASKGLPTAARLALSQGSGEWLPVESLERDDFAGVRFLDVHVMKSGHARDSFPHIAARVIVAAYWMGHTDRQRAVEAAFELGRIGALSQLYAAETAAAKKAGGRTKRRWWAEDVAAEITGWADIPESYRPMVIETDQAVLTVYRDGDPIRGSERIICLIDGKEQSLAKKTFLNRYFSRRRR